MRLVLFIALIAVAGAFVPAAAFPGPECIPMCVVPSTTVGFVPPFTMVNSDASVTWTADDGAAHTASSENFCLHVGYSAAREGYSSFFVYYGNLYVQAGPQPAKKCTEATPLPTGQFELPYRCLYHVAMRATLLVNP